MTSQDARSELAASSRTRPIRASTVVITVCVALVLGAAPFLWLQVQKPKPWEPPAPIIAAQTPTQLAQNARFLKALAAMPKPKRLRYLFENQDLSRQSALSPDANQRHTIYALIGQKEPNGP